MKRFDVNCFLGHWPFHSTAYPDCEHLAAAHKAAGIEGGLITSLQTVFYLDPLTAAKQLYQQLPEGYGQVFAINPALPDADQLCVNAYENYAVKGIRLVPTFHNFSWEDEGTQAVLSAVEKLKLPLFITLNLEDPRVDYMVLQSSLDMDRLSGVLKDLPDYTATHRRLLKDYEDKDVWLKKAVLNTASSGMFSSDRTIREYNDKIWHLTPLEL